MKRLSILQINCLYYVASARFIFFATPSNFNILERSLMTRRNTLVDIFLALNFLKMISNHKDITIILRADNLYSLFIEFLLLLVPHVMLFF